jgi:hypothetical protein
MERGIRTLFSELTTRRSLNNRCHATHAVGFLHPERVGEDYRYLFDPETGRMRKTILTALGRLSMDCETQEEAGEYVCEAAAICEERMKTAEALEFISDLRQLLRAGAL